MIQRSDWKWLLTVAFGLIVIWTGLMRSIDAQAFKPNAFFFCMTTGIIALVAAFFYRAQMLWTGMSIALVATVPVLLFYLIKFISEPEVDANTRVGFVILASIAQLLVILFPTRKESTNSSGKSSG